jgi:hypothetical protein
MVSLRDSVVEPCCPTVFKLKREDYFVKCRPDANLCFATSRHCHSKINFFHLSLQ